MTAYGIMFHHFCDKLHPRGQGAISASELVDIINHVGRQHILPADEWMRRALGGELRESDVCLTFDDALRCQYDVAFPVLQDMGLTAFWFVYSSVFEGNSEPLEVYRYFRTTSFTSVDDFYDCFETFVEKTHPNEFRKAMAGFKPDEYLAAFPFYSKSDRVFRYLRDDVLGASNYNHVMRSIMAEKGFDAKSATELLWINNKHLKVLKEAGHLIGLHSYTHPTRMVELQVDAQASEYQKNFNHLENVLGEKPSCMSHPCNSYSASTLPILKQLGIQLGFRANMVDVQDRSHLEFPRQDHANILKEIQS